MVNFNEKCYMNTATGSVDNYDGWWYVNEKGEKVNAVDLGEVVEVEKDEDGDWEFEVEGVDDEVMVEEQADDVIDKLMAEEGSET